MAQPKASQAVDPTRRDPSDDPKFADRPLADPSGRKGDIPENPDTEPGMQPGTVTTDQGTGQSREILLPDGTKAGSTTQATGGGDAVPSWGSQDGQTQRAEANRLPTEEEALAELEANPERNSVLSVAGHVTRDRLQKIRFDVEGRRGISELTVKSEKNGTVTVDKAPV